MYVWRYLDPDGGVVGDSEQFADQEAAEAWLAAEWEPLREAGVDEVLLFDEAEAVVVYRMSLEPDEA